MNKVKLFFNDLVNPAPVLAAAPDAPALPTEYELKDGGKVMIDKLEVGGVVMIDGNPSLPGDVELVDGTKITISDNGVISALVTAEAPAETAPVVEDMGTKFASFETLTNEKFSSYEQKFASYEERFGQYEVKLGQYKEMIEQLLQFGKLMVEAPQGQPDTAVKTTNAFAEKRKINTDNLFN